MRYAEIDVGGRSHCVAIVNDQYAVLLKPASFTESASGYERLFTLLGTPIEMLVVMEATGHYGRNLCGALVERGFQIAVVNPLRTRRFAEEELMRAKTDSVDALGIARFAAQKRPTATPWDPGSDDLRELVRYHNRLLQDFGDRVRQLARLVRLGFPEFIDHVRTLDSQRATAILRDFPTAAAFTPDRLEQLAAVTERGIRRRRVELKMARPLVQAAQHSVGRHHGTAFRTQIRSLCEDIDMLRDRVQALTEDIGIIVHQHPVGSLLLSIDGIGTTTVARILATGDPARFRSGAALAAYVGVAPGTRASGLRWSAHAHLNRIGHSRLRRALYMATLSAVQRNAWLGSYYRRLKARGKLPKVALVATMRKLLVAVYSVTKHRRPFVAHQQHAAAAQDCGRVSACPDETP